MNPVRPGALKGASGTQAGEQERRRGQRVMLRVKVKIHVALQGKATTFETATVSVSPVGALVAMQRNLGADTRLVLEHTGTSERVACKISRPPREMPDGFHTALEFDSPSVDFWKIAFPPADWRAEDL
ncbi:MAG: hypothetical protein LAN59_02160 [Acidobacteriia bacterium]|nr:hypothetical protein [Terriglobia bacterium]